MKKYIDNVVKFLIDRFPENINNHYYDGTGIYTIEHTIPDLYSNNEFVNVVAVNLYDNNIYNVYFMNISDMTLEEIEGLRCIEYK